ncbi:ABC transporter substrate-binding protein [Marinivivus vitaminiproducens]|uniref:ABC transporter substrate-binding protein n=1 Tax=Marinivivus vitaminiproducens TaxID=3035935 RepID=UPI0027A44F78|nr:ABC transporter substrate-binding protein [Geminicoccaceae bacterium SCSIO 64248]
MKNAPIWLAATAILFATATAPRAQEERAEVIHWWTSGGESAGVRVIAEAFEKAGGTWVDNAVAGGTNARTAAINRIVGGNPPTMVQFNTGRQFEELVDNGLLRPLDDIAEAQGWKDVLPPAILDAITRDGSIYAVPVNIHGTAWMFHNAKIFQDAGVTPPTTWQEVIDVAPALREKGIIPLALGGQPTWEHSLFNAILADEGGPELFRSVYGEGDSGAVEEDGFRHVAELYGQMRDLVDPGSPGRNWNDAVALVITGKAAMTENGDWAKGEFIAAGQQPDADYGCTLMGPHAPMLIGGDVFVFPVIEDDAVIATQDKLAGLILSDQVQIDFNKVKGSIPVRQDVDVSSMDACAQKARAAMNDPARQLEAQELLSTPDRTGATRDVISQFWNNKQATTDDFVQNFADALDSTY